MVNNYNIDFTINPDETINGGEQIVTYGNDLNEKISNIREVI